MFDDHHIDQYAGHIGASIAGGKSLEQVKAFLRLVNTPEELLELAVARYELGLFDINGPIVVVDQPKRAQWYAGPQAGDKFWPPVHEKLRSQLPTDDVIDIDKVTSVTLSLLPAPGTPSFSARGLVLGYVQSGKTTNFMALAAKAADRGYKLIIILSGMTNILRNQTQERIDEVLVGEARLQWHSLTTVDADFHQSGDPSPLFVNFNGALVAVMKKNPSRLRGLRDWLRSAGPVALQHAPLLLIDDEADQASIDVGNDRVSTINGLLRQILEHPRAAYVAYTATPFANLLIDPKNEQGLYPRDFIVSMPRPNGYFGVEALFGAVDDPDAEGLDVIRTIPAAEALEARPPAGKGAVDAWAPAAGVELRQAMIWFLLATAARRSRHGRVQHSSMLVHSSMLSEAHFRTREAVIGALGRLQKGILTDSADLRAEAQAVYEAETVRVPASDFDHAPVPFEDAWSKVSEVANEIEVIVDNYKSDDRLSYANDRATTAIVIGGNTLSRGLTLSGLCSSYFVRSASAYDTLLQMGRWFGYRDGYEDLCRIWITDELQKWFRDLSGVELEIRDEIARYAIEGLTPLELGVRIRLHPDLAITEASKMKHAMAASLSYGGRSPQTTLFKRLDAARLGGNLEATRTLLEEILRHGGEPTSFQSGPTLSRNVQGFTGVPAEFILHYLSAYVFDEEQRGLTSELLTQYIRDELQRESLGKWRVVIMDGPNGEEVKLPGVGAVRAVIRSRIGGTDEGVGAIRALTSAEDRTAGIDWAPGELPPTGAALVALRGERHPAEGILRIYPVDRVSAPAAGLKTRVPLDAADIVIGLSIDFPGSLVPSRAIGYMIADVPGSDAVEESEDPSLADEADEADASDPGDRYDDEEGTTGE
jgi:hypothetical protein